MHPNSQGECQLLISEGADVRGVLVERIFTLSKNAIRITVMAKKETLIRLL